MYRTSVKRSDGVSMKNCTTLSQRNSLYCTIPRKRTSYCKPPSEVRYNPSPYARLNPHPTTPNRFSGGHMISQRPSQFYDSLYMSNKSNITDSCYVSGNNSTNLHLTTSPVCCESPMHSNNKKYATSPMTSHIRICDRDDSPFLGRRPNCSGREGSPCWSMREVPDVTSTGICAGVSFPSPQKIVPGQDLFRYTESKLHSQMGSKGVNADITDEAISESMSFSSRSLGNSVTSSSNVGSLDTNWDNSSLDVSCSTCGVDSDHSAGDFTEPLYRPLHHLLFMKHVMSCEVCIEKGDLCECAKQMEKHLSSFFELDLSGDHHQSHPESSFQRASSARKYTSIKRPKQMWPMDSSFSMYGGKENESRGESFEDLSFQQYSVEMLSKVKECVDYKSFVSDPKKSLKQVDVDDVLTRSPRCKSAMTSSSDRSDFMNRPLCKVPVTGSRVGKQIQNHIGKKVRKLARYMNQLRKGPLNQQTKNKAFKTLAVL